MNNRFLQIIQETERRYEAHQPERERRAHHLEQLRSHGEGDWREIDEPKRVLRRLLSEGMVDAVSGAMAATAMTPAEVVPEDAVFFDALERIIEKNELMSSAFLRRGAAASRSVGRVVLRTATGRVAGFGTGFLVSPRLLLTNNHVLTSEADATLASVQFNYYETYEGVLTTPLEYRLAPSTFFETSAPLDFTLIAVDSAPADSVPLDSLGWSPLIAPSGKAIVGERVNVVQHPGGEPQQLALRQNEITDVPGDFLHYTADTNRGSSGSPVFNDQWEVAALHHSGVPRRENGRIMLVSGVPWDGSNLTVGQIHWIANEGVRISRIVAELNRRAPRMAPAARALFERAFDPCEANIHWPGTTPGIGPDETHSAQNAATNGARQALATTANPRIDQHGYTYWTVPVEIRVGIGARQRSPSTPLDEPQVTGGSATGAQVAGSSGATLASAPDEDVLRHALDRLKEGRRRPYYDAEADEEARDTYYAGLPGNRRRSTLYGALHSLLRSTHTTVLPYRSARLEYLYPWVDLREDEDGHRSLMSIYSGKGFSPEEIIREELAIEALRETRLREFVANESTTPEALETFLDGLEASSPYNCEHVVPQSWFGKADPMRTDLHHLFTCEWGCNSFRSNIPYYDFSPEEEAFRTDCGRRTGDKFEPVAGKGAVARSTLYFLLRYPGLMGDASRELQRQRLPILLDWHGAEPITDYERHRNAAIAEIQGNRNPLIDYPDWAERIDFSIGFGTP